MRIDYLGIGMKKMKFKAEMEKKNTDGVIRDWVWRRQSLKLK